MHPKEAKNDGLDCIEVLHDRDLTEVFSEPCSELQDCTRAGNLLTAWVTIQILKVGF